MTCKHGPNDPSCSSYRESALRYGPPTPDANNFHIVDVVEVGKHMVMKVKYPNCAKCAYEGTKVLVYLNCGPIQALRWKKIDPHFDNTVRLYDEAPSPDARFPASESGWDHAIAFASGVV